MDTRCYHKEDQALPPLPPPPPLETHTVVHEPLELYPLYPIRTASRVHRVVQAPNGHVYPRLVIQPTTTTTTTTTTRPLSYAIDRVLQRRPNTGTTLFLATPATLPANDSLDDDPAASSSSFNPSLLVCCGASVVVKIVPHLPPNPRRVIDSPITELSAHQHLSQHPHHPYLTPLLDCMQDDDFIYLVMPYLSGGDLYSKVEATQDRGLPDAQAASYLRQICEGLLFMKQTCNIAHHDVSLENIMLTHEGKATIIDLGMCLRVPKGPLGDVSEEESGGHSSGGGGYVNINNSPHRHRRQVVHLTAQTCRGKPSYLSKERGCEEAHDPFAADVWSLGICMYMMLTGRPIYDNPNSPAFISLASGGVREVLACYETHGLCLSPLAKDLVCRMLQADPTKRPTLEEVLAHPFLSNEVVVYS